MDRFVPLLLSCALLLVCAFSGSGQESAQPRKFQTTYKIDMFAAPDVNAKKIGNVPADVILEAQEETQRYGRLHQGDLQKQDGLRFQGRSQTIHGPARARTVCWSNGYKTIGGVYRYFSFCAMTARCPTSEE
jgi:hypothetical protein